MLESLIRPSVGVQQVAPLKKIENMWLMRSLLSGMVFGIFGFWFSLTSKVHGRKKISWAHGGHHTLFFTRSDKEG